MENNDQAKVSGWVDGRLEGLRSCNDWRPDTARALARLRQKDRTRKSRRILTLAAVATIGAVIALVPASRKAVRQLWAGSRIVNIGQVSADVKALKDGQAAPDFALRDATGANLRLSAYKGKVVLLNFWATWCHGCTLEIPWLIQFQKTYKGRGFAVIGVSMDDDGWKAVRPFIGSEKVNYPVVVGNEKMAKPYGLDAMPMTFLIDRQGRIAATSVGVIDRAACERQIVELLNRTRE